MKVLPDKRHLLAGPPERDRVLHVLQHEPFPKRHGRTKVLERDGRLDHLHVSVADGGSTHETTQRGEPSRAQDLLECVAPLL